MVFYIKYESSHSNLTGFRKILSASLSPPRVLPGELQQTSATVVFMVCSQSCLLLHASTPQAAPVHEESAWLTVDVSKI